MGDVRIEAPARACRVVTFVSVASERLGRDTELFSGPSECECSSVELFLCHLLFVEVSFADNEEMAGRVITRRGVAHDMRVTQSVDVPLAVHAYVIGDVDPPLCVLVIVLVLAKASGGVAVVAEDCSGVVNRHAVEGWLRYTARPRRLRAPRVAAQHDPRSGGDGRCGCSHRRHWQVSRRACVGSRRGIGLWGRGWSRVPAGGSGRQSCGPGQLQ